ncbi:MAG: DUF4919 domain-containing protein [Rikenellaceae bacterium]|jgi:hypothetical protein|nr:DUF4919 domain-containing protein [Rikenellaceae bacterium]
MKKILVLLMLCLPLALFAQKYRVPDNDSIFTQIHDASSPYYYPTLIGRYMKGDRSLTTDDYHYLYYGYAFQPGYSPMDPLPGMDNILMVLELTPEPDSLGCARIIANGRRVMERDPFNPAALNLVAYAHTIIGDTVSARTNAICVENILRTIRRSGSGVSERSPWAILAFSHGEDVVSSLGLQVTSRRVVSRTVEYLDIGHREGKIKGFFFDYSRVYWNKPETTPEPQIQGFSINGIKVK